MLEKLWPNSSRQDERGDLWLGGCSVTRLAADHGTPLYIFDEATLRDRARCYLAALKRHYPGPAQIAYAAKAYLNLAIAQIWNQEGLDLDVVSGGELQVALAAGFPAERIHFHGNNKTPAELHEALAAGVGRIVVDNFHELALLADLTAAGRSPRAAVRPVPIWLRLAPGIQAHTHAHIQTGHLDTKFGFAIATGDAEAAVAQALAAPGLALIGFHCHIGSQIYEADALALAATRLIEFAGQMGARYGFQLRELSPGGGWGVPMVESDPDAPIESYIAGLADAIAAACQRVGLALPHLILEPGRSLVAPAGVAVYTVGSRKEIPGVRTYVAVDGGMADNIRPALYGARYTALRIPASGPRPPAPSPRSELVTIAGRFCESGDVLIRDIELPALGPGDLLAVPMAGAYTLAMASNYNLARRPAVVLVNQGKARLIQRRETYADLWARDLPLDSAEAMPSASTAGVAQARRSAFYGSRFTKYHALGNDYIVLDPVEWPQPPTAAQIRRICDRHTGIGADGILWGPIAPETFATHVAAEKTRAAEETSPLRPVGAGFRAAVRLFNPDGGEFEKSGNGLRIFARYLWERGLSAGPDFVIETSAGPVVAHVLDDAGDRIALEMGRLSFSGQEIPLVGSPAEVIETPVTVAGHTLRITAVGIGNPHCVVFVDAPLLAAFGALEALAQALGPHLERLPLFPNRTNVQFVQVGGPHALRMAIWERGAGYTLASGTSSCAAAGAAVRTGRCASPITVQMPGGELLVEIGPDWTARLTGSVTPVCEGRLRLL